MLLNLSYSGCAQHVLAFKFCTAAIHESRAKAHFPEYLQRSWLSPEDAFDEHSILLHLLGHLQQETAYETQSLPPEANPPTYELFPSFSFFLRAATKKSPVRTPHNQRCRDLETLFLSPICMRCIVVFDWAVFRALKRKTSQSKMQSAGKKTR